MQTIFTCWLLHQVWGGTHIIFHGITDTAAFSHRKEETLDLSCHKHLLFCRILYFPWYFGGNLPEIKKIRNWEKQKEGKTVKVSLKCIHTWKTCWNSSHIKGMIIASLLQMPFLPLDSVKIAIRNKHLHGKLLFMKNQGEQVQWANKIVWL